MKPNVALVYPPFGPKSVPPLGLSLLSAGVKRHGFDCRVFYWNLELIRELPFDSLETRLFIYERISRNGFFPQNEWIFSREVFPEHENGQVVGRHLAQLDNRFGYSKRRRWSRTARRPQVLDQRPSELALQLRERAPQLVEDMAQALAGYDIVGINSTFYQNFAALALAKKLKHLWPDKIVVLGGANCDGELGHSLIEHFPFLDFVFSGEVDFSFPEFVRSVSQKRPVGEIPGILFRDDRGVVVSGPRAMPVQEMDQLPIPDFDDYVATRERLGLNRNHQTVLAVESSRGCWWGAKQHCTFCGLNALGMSYREKSQERFLAEIEELAERYRTRHLAVTDNILSMSYFRDFMQWAQQSKTEINMFWEVKANLDRQKVKSLAEAGINWVQPGIESFSSEVLKLMRKGVKGIQNLAFLKYARENGVVTSYFILYGFPGESASEYKKMATNLRKLVHLEPPRAVAEIEYDRFSPYHQDPASFGIRLRPKAEYRILYPFDDESITRLVYFFERVDPPKFRYIRRLKNEVLRWQGIYQDTSGPTQSLTWELENGDVVIDDCRPGFPRRRYRLQDYAVQVFYSLDQPTTLPAAIKSSPDAHSPFSDPTARALRETLPPPNGQLSDNRRRRWRSFELGSWRRAPAETLISFSRHEFEARPAEALSPLVTAGIVYVEEDWWLALPVASHSPRPARWELVSAQD